MILDKETMEQCRAQGMTRKQVMGKYGKSYSGVNQAIIRTGVRLSPEERRGAKRLEIEADIKAGLKDAEIGRKHGVSRQWVNRVRRQS